MKPDEKDVIKYYNTPESKRGYQLFLGGTRHFGYYEPGDKPWQFKKALRQMEDQLAQALSLPPFSKVLDAGCGMGDVASYLATNYQLTIVAIDILDFHLQEAMARVKQRGLEDKITFQKMNYAKLQLPHDSFDGAYTVETFVHAPEPANTLKEFYKVLKPGGKLAMFEYSRDPDNKTSERAARMIKKVNELAAMPAFQQFYHGTQERLMKEAGFENIEVKDISQHIAPMLRMFFYAAFIPYKILCLFGQQDRVPNAMSAVEFWRYRKHIRYVIFTANKPK